MLAAHPHSQNLAVSILKLEAPTDNEKSQAKLRLANIAMDLMPAGVVDFDKLKECAPIKSLVEGIGKTEMQTLLFLLISNFCKSINVVRNMGEDQMIECAMYLLDECKDYTMEDYVVMFAMAKRGKIGNVMDHLDIEVVAEMHAEYAARRRTHFKTAQDKAEREAYDKKVAGLGPKDIAACEEAVKKMKEITYHFINLEAIEDERKKQATLKALKDNRDRQIINFVDHMGAQGYAPDIETMKYYLKAIGK